MTENIISSRCSLNMNQKNFIKKYLTYIYIMVKSYCVKEKKQTECVPESEH